MTTHTMQPPKAVGLYDPSFEHDACGVGMVARLDNRPTHEVIRKAITALENLEHRGASGADPRTGDGAGILLQMPDELLRAVVDFELPRMGEYGVLMCFLPRDDGARARLEALLERTVLAEGQRVLGWRDVPVCPEHTGEVAGACRPAAASIRPWRSSQRRAMGRQAGLSIHAMDCAGAGASPSISSAPMQSDSRHRASNSRFHSRNTRDSSEPAA